MAEYILPNGVTLHTRVNEFIQHVTELEVNPRAADYIGALVMLEKAWIDNNYRYTPETEEILATSMIYDKITNTAINQTRFWTNLEPDISPYLCTWVNSMTHNGKAYMALLGTFAHHFYQFNPRTKCCTLGWIVDRIGAGRMIADFPDIYNLTMDLLVAPPIGVDDASALTNKDVAFDLLNEEEFYTYDNR